MSADRRRPPLALLVPAVAGAAFLVLPLVALLQRAPWSDLVDELNLRIYPVIIGDGLRLFPENGQTHNLELVDSRSTSTGVMIQTYRPAGRATFAGVDE